MKMIVAVDTNWGIGFENNLLVSIPEDMKFFRKTTMGKIVVMGRKTLESFPQQKPLENRVNIVLTSSENYFVENAIICHSKEELLKKLEEYNSDDVFVIGGSSVYSELLLFCDTIYVTKVNHSYVADSFFPNLDNLKDWKIIERSGKQFYEEIEYEFLVYKNEN